ncbi:MAG: YihY family inner membrane protein [Desulfobacterales bacterium]|nr:MAG: YihY family inner membrane protein [Desulfobacterales bacterium]
MKTPLKQRVQAWRSKSRDFLRFDIWRIRMEDLSWGRSFCIGQLRVLILTARGFHKDKCLLRASSLTFYTLFSIVPVFAMFFGIAKGFGFEKMLEKELLHNFPGQEEALSRVINFSSSLLENTKGGVIAGIGLAVLFWSVIRVLSHIESAFNDIWEIKENRSLSRKFSDYLSLMLISPILVLMSGSATVFIRTQVTNITEQIAFISMFSEAIFFLLKFMPFFLVWILFTVVYLIMPNAKVNFKAGLAAGVIAGTIYQAAQGVYLGFQIGAARYNAIYGSFAALPLFLMWVQVSWWIVLFGAELSFAFQNVSSYEYEPDCLNVSPAFKKLLALQTAHLLIQNFARGEKPLTGPQIARRLAMPIRLVRHILYELVESNVVSETRVQENKEPGYQPARDINGLTIQYIIEALECNGTDDIPVAQTAELKVLSDALQQFSRAMENSPANKRLKDI